MAQGKLSPRQKMINMMYLVLTALLALNVSKEIINAFVTVNESLVLTRNNVADKNKITYDAFKLAMTNDAKKWNDANAKAQQAKKEADTLSSFIENLKIDLVRQTEGLDSTEKVPELRDMDKKDNYDIPTYIMCGDKNDGIGAQATALKGKMDSFKNTMLKFFEDPKVKASFQARLESSLDTKPSDKVEDGKRTWEMQKFYHNPVVATVALLTKFQGDVKNSEAQVIEHLYTSVEAFQYKPDLLNAEVIPESNYILIGQEYKARVFLSATSSTLAPDVFIGAKIDPATKQIVGAPSNPLPTQGGIAQFTTSPKSEGEQTWGGVIRVKNPDNTFTNYPFESKYIAAKPAGVVSADKMNVLYIGVPNPMTISVPGVAGKNVKPSGSNGVTLQANPKLGEGHYIATATTQGECTFTVNAEFGGKSQVMGKVPYRVKRLPDPVAKIAGSKGGPISKSVLAAQSAVIPEMENFDFELYPIITGFRMSMYRRGQDPIEIDVTGNKLSSKMQDEIRKAKVGDKVYFEYINAEMPDHTKRKLASVNFVLN